MRILFGTNLIHQPSRIGTSSDEPISDLVSCFGRHSSHRTFCTQVDVWDLGPADSGSPRLAARRLRHLVLLVLVAIVDGVRTPTER